ncbi:putative serine/threonine-protein kinase PkwA [subsurface metagenome]
MINKLRALLISIFLLFFAGGLFAEDANTDNTNIPSNTGEVEVLIHGSHLKDANILAVSPDSSILASGSKDNLVKLWDTDSGKLLLDLTGHTAGITSAVFVDRGSTLITGSKDGTVKVWEVPSGRLIKTIDYLDNYGTYPNSLAAEPEGNIIVIGTTGGMLYQLDLQTGKLIKKLRAGGSVISVGYTSDLKYIVALCLPGIIELRDAVSLKLLKTLEKESKTAVCIALSSNPDILVSGGKDKKIKLWDISTGETIRILEGVEKKFLSLL